MTPLFRSVASVVNGNLVPLHAVQCDVAYQDFPKAVQYETIYYTHGIILLPIQCSYYMKNLGKV